MCVLLALLDLIFAGLSGHAPIVHSRTSIAVSYLAGGEKELVHYVAAANSGNDDGDDDNSDNAWRTLGVEGLKGGGERNLERELMG